MCVPFASALAAELTLHCLHAQPLSQVDGTDLSNRDTCAHSLCRIKNTAYKGIWVAPDIDNPDFKDDPKLHVQKDIKYIGFELWQVRRGCLIFLG